MKDTEQLNAVLRDQYDILCQNSASIIVPRLMAEAACNVLDGENSAPHLLRWAAILELRELARKICAARFSDEERLAEQASLFDFQLQPRYPALRDGENVYVPRALLSLEERRRNIARLRSDAAAKQAHADALEAETDHMLRRGDLVSIGEVSR